MKNLILNSLHTTGASSLLRGRKKNQLTVLSLHRISNERNIFWNPIQPKAFNQLLTYVKTNYNVIGFEELEHIGDAKSTKPYLILSFDDGYYDFYEFALPLLVKHGLPSNHNIVNECANKNKIIWTQRLNVLFESCVQNSISLEVEFANRKSTISDFENSWMSFYLDTFKTLLDMPISERESVINELQNAIGIDTSCRMMNWDEIRECNVNGVEIGSHTFAHDSLGTIKDHAALEKEILTSKRETEKSLGKKVNVFALPNGQTGKQADEVISNSDYKFVLYVDDKLNRMPISKYNNPIPISRINLVDEPFPQMALRIEQFHKMLRRNG